VKVEILKESDIPAHLQVLNQIKKALLSEQSAVTELLIDTKNASAVLGIDQTVLEKALRQLEFQGLVRRKTEKSFTLNSDANANRYSARGVSSDKKEVHEVVDSLDRGLFPGAFCKITQDYLTGRKEYCNLTHSDGAGTKSIVAYLHYKETGDASVFRGIAQDSIVMNLDDLICSGVSSSILLSSTINRNAINCPQEIIQEIILGSEEFLQSVRDLGINVRSGGGETADVGDLTGTVIVDSCATAIMERKQVVLNNISEDLVILGLSSTGRSKYEMEENSGIGSNGLTSARHELLSKIYKEKYPETTDFNVDPALTYCGIYRLDDELPGSSMTIGSALLSPTRTYAPLVIALRKLLGKNIKALVHCSGGGQTKCLHFGKKIHFIKDNLFEIPPLFKAIKEQSKVSWEEMYKTFNMGHRMEIYLPYECAEEAISVADTFQIKAKIVGHTERSEKNRLTLINNTKEVFSYC